MNDIVFDKLSYSIAHHEYLEYLIISHNDLTDESFKLLASMVQTQPSLKHIDLQYNKFEGRKYLDEFLESVMQCLKLSYLDLSNNLLIDETVDLMISYIFKQENSSLKTLNLSYNRYTKQGHYRLFNSYYLSKSKETLQAILKPIPFHASFLKFLAFNKDSFDLTLERIPSGIIQKPSASKLSDCQTIQGIINNIESIKQKDVTIEEISKICDKIFNLEYEFPPQKLDHLYFILKEKIEKSFEVQDYHSINLLMNSAHQVGLSTAEYDTQLREIKIKLDQVNNDLIDILNCKYPEQIINKILDEKLTQVFKMGIRGYLVDTLLWIKERRDEIIKKLHKENYQEDELDDISIGPYAILDRFFEYSKISNITSLNVKINKWLLLHPLLVDYFEMSRLSLEQIQDSMKESVDYLKKKENYYLRNSHNRCYFILTDNSISKTFKLAKGDKKLFCARLIIQYRNYLQPRIERKPRPQKLILPITTLPDLKSSEDYFNENKMQNFIYLRHLKDFNNRLIADAAQFDKKNDKMAQNFHYKKSVSDVLEFFCSPLPCTIMNFSNKDAEQFAVVLSSVLFEIYIKKEEEELLVIINILIKLL